MDYIFLNIEKKAILEYRKEYKNDAVTLSGNVSIATILILYHELNEVLRDMLSSPTVLLGADRRAAITSSLAEQLERARNEVVFRAPNSLQIRVNMICDDIISQVWSNMARIFLSTPHWDDVLGRCPRCKKWFRKSRKDQIYCRTKG